MRQVVIALLVCGAAFCFSAFLAAAGKTGMFWPGTAKQPMSLMLAGTAGLFFLFAAMGFVWTIVPVKQWRAQVVIAASLSLALCFLCYTPWTIFGIIVDIVLLWGIFAKGWSTDVGRETVSRGVSEGIHPLMHIPVPWVFILAYCVGVGIQYAFPMPIHSAQLLSLSHIAGFALMFFGVVLAAWCLGLFRAARTTTVPFERSCELVESGPYRLCRNPMYVSLTLMYLGEAGLLAQVWPLLMLVLVLIYLSRIVIPVEEARLRDVFGDTYERYCSRVRRWM